MKKLVSSKQIAVALLVITALLTAALSTRATEAKPDALVMTLHPGATIPLAFATVDQVRVMTADEAARCICQGYCIWKNFGTYSNWARECVEGTNVFYIEGVGTQFYCAYCPPSPC